MAKKLNPVDGTKFVVALDRNQLNTVIQALEMYHRVAVGDLDAVAEHHDFNATNVGSSIAGHGLLNDYRKWRLDLGDTEAFSVFGDNVSALAAVAHDVRLSLRIARAQVENPGFEIEWKPLRPDVPRAEVDIEIPPDGTVEMIEGATLSQFAEAQTVYAPYVPLTVGPVFVEPIAAPYVPLKSKEAKFSDEIADELYGTLELSETAPAQPIAQTKSNWAAQFVALACNHFPGKDGLLAVKLHMLKTGIQSSPINDEGKAQIAKYIGVPPQHLQFTADEFEANLDLIKSITKLFKKEEPKTKKLAAKWGPLLSGVAPSLAPHIEKETIESTIMKTVSAMNDEKFPDIVSGLAPESPAPTEQSGTAYAVDGKVFSSKADLDHFKSSLAASLGLPVDMVFGKPEVVFATPVQMAPSWTPELDLLLDDAFLSELENGTPKQPC